MHQHETLERLNALIEERHLHRSKLISPEDLAARTALPEDVVTTLLQGGVLPADTVNDRVRARIKTLSDAHLARTGRRPVYAQGISVAAQGALSLRDQILAGLTPGLARRAQRAIARPVGTAWDLAVGQDIHFSTTTGRSPKPADRLLHRYVSRLSRTATGSFRAATALTDVLALQALPTSLVKPSVLLAALVGPLRPDRRRPHPAARHLREGWRIGSGPAERGMPT